MGRLYRVADGILDEAIEDYREENLKSVENVMMYADGSGIDIELEEAEQILLVCRNWLKVIEEDECPGSNARYCTVQLPLNEFEEKQKK